MFLKTSRGPSVLPYTSTMTFFFGIQGLKYIQRIHTCALCFVWESWINFIQNFVNVLIERCADCGFCLSHIQPRAPYRPRTGISNVSISYGTRKGPVRDPQGCRMVPLRTRKGIDTTEFAKIPNGRRMWPYGPLVVPHGLFMGCLWSLTPYGARKLIMHALKLYESRTGRQIRTAPHGSRTGPVSGRTIFLQNSHEQPGNSPYGARCDVTWELLKTSETFKCNRCGRRSNVQYISFIE